MQGHSLDKRIQSASRSRLKPLFQRLLTAPHPVLHHRLQRRLAAAKRIQLIHQLHISRGRHLGAKDQLGNRIAGLFTAADRGKKLLVLRGHIAGKNAKRLFYQRVNAAEIVGQRA